MLHYPHALPWVYYACKCDVLECVLSHTKQQVIPNFKHSSTKMGVDGYCTLHYSGDVLKLFQRFSIRQCKGKEMYISQEWVGLGLQHVGVQCEKVTWLRRKVGSKRGATRCCSVCTCHTLTCVTVFGFPRDMRRVSAWLLGLKFYQSWCFSRKDFPCEWNCSYQSTLCTFSSSKAKLWLVCSFQQEQTFIFNTAACHSREPERSHLRTLTDRSPHSVPEQGASQQPVDATRRTCTTNLQLHPSSGSAWSASLMAHTRASPHANSAEAWGPVLVSHRHLFSVDEETSTNARTVKCFVFI
jgi:hypothetical protein